MQNEIESQEKRILKYLQAGRSITAMCALQKFQSFRLASRIFNLRKQGPEIINIGETRNGKNFGRYKLVKKVVSK